MRKQSNSSCALVLALHMKCANLIHKPGVVAKHYVMIGFGGSWKELLSDGPQADLFTDQIVCICW